MTTWRLLQIETSDAFHNMAIDEAVLTARVKGLVPNTLRFYRWYPSAVSIGRFQNVFKQIHVTNCQQNGVDIVRRISGGGTVYHDYNGEITYSVVVSKRDLGTQDIVVAYNTICNGLIEAIKILGVTAEYNPGDPRNCPNISINGKKISGSSQLYKGGVLLQHGTLLLGVDLMKMFSFLRVPWLKSINDVICVAKKKITSIHNELSSKITIEKAHQALIQGFQKAFNTQFYGEEALASYELELAQLLCREKYVSDNWNLEGK